MKISIIIPIYNLEKVIENCLYSLQQQKFKDFEAIIINDGSIDKSYNIVNSFCKNDSRFKIFSFENAGASIARNRGIFLANGDYILFIDGDDTINEKYLSSYAQAIEESNADIIIGGLTFIEEKEIIKSLKQNKLGNISVPIFWKIVCNDNSGIYGFVASKAYKRNLIKNYNIQFSEKLKLHEDLSFALDAYSCAKTYYFINEDGYYYNIVHGRRTSPPLEYANILAKLIYRAQIIGNVSIDEMLPQIKYVGGLISHFIYNYKENLTKEKFYCALNEYSFLKDLLSNIKFKKIISLQSIGNWLTLNNYYNVLNIYKIIFFQIRKIKINF